MDPTVRSKIDEVVKGNDVVLFMKGTRQAPQCGFSATVVNILDAHLESYHTVNVLADEAVRQGIKEYSDWPTIPQLYIKGEFVGGCDIVKDLNETGQLEETLGVPVKEVAPPAITVTEPAATALRQALTSAAEFVRLEIDASYHHDLSIGPKNPRDIVVSTAGIALVVDRGSVKRAEGITIDFLSTPQGPAFKITNPNEPPRVKPISVQELKAKIDGASAPLALFDVRSTKERETAQIVGSRLLDREAQRYILSLPKDTPLYFHCHHGPRAQQAAEFFIAQGFKNVFNLSGGINAWSLEIDPSVPRY